VRGTEKEFGGLDDAAGACGKGLTFGERFVLWGLRTWAQSQARASTSAHYHCAALRRAFDLAGLADAHLVFDRFLTAVQAHGLRDIGLHAPRCPSVAADELAILRIVAEGQSGVVTDASMADIVAEEGREEVARAAQQLAFLMAVRGMFIRSLEPASGETARPRGEWRDNAPPRNLH
jgi:hypothetical protein